MSQISSNEIIKKNIQDALKGQILKGVSFLPVCYEESPPFCNRDEIYFEDVPQPFRLYTNDYEVTIDLQETEFDSELVVDINNQRGFIIKAVDENISQFWRNLIGHKIVEIFFLFEMMSNKVLLNSKEVKKEKINCFTGIAFLFDNKVSFSIYSADILEYDDNTYTFGRPANSKILVYQRDKRIVYNNLPAFIPKH